MKFYAAPLLLTLVILALATQVRADGPLAHRTVLWTASDLARQAEHPLSLPSGGEMTVKVWSAPQEVWTLGVEGPNLTLQSKNVGAEGKSGWKTVGKANLAAGPLKLVVPSSENESPPPLPLFVAIVDDPRAEPSVELFRGDLKYLKPTDDARRTKIRTNKQGTDFHAPATIEAWRDRSLAVREQLLVALGLWPMPPKTPLHPRIMGKLEREGYTIEKTVIETLPGFFLGGNLYRPTEKAGKLPIMLCPHGHWEEGRVNVDVQRRCIQWAKLGCVVFLYDMVGYADSKAFGHVFLNNRLRLHGYSLPSLQTWNSIRALDWLSSLPDVDPTRVACTGESGGGTQTFLLTAIDDRVKVSAPVVMVSDWFQGGCSCENCAGLRIGTDNIEIAALTAPRPMKLVGATGDWTAKTMTLAYPNIRAVYALTGSTDRLSADVFDYPHNYNMTTRNAVYAFVSKWLLGIEDSSATREGELKVEDPADLYAFTESTPPPSNLKTAAQLENDLIETLDWQLDALAPSASPAAWEASRRMLKTSAKVRVGLVNPSRAALNWVSEQKLSLMNVRIQHTVVGREGMGDMIPVVRLIPSNATGRLTVITHARGKAGLGDLAEGSLARELLNRGQSVVAYDPIFVGEAFDRTTRSARRPDTAHFETYNPTVAVDQMQDLSTVLAWAREQPDVREVSLVGGPQALIARPLLEGLARTAIDLEGFDEAGGSKVLAPDFDVPGLLQFGGIKVAAALSSPAPLWIYRITSAFDSSWSAKAYELQGVSHVLRIDPRVPTSAELARWIDAGE